MLIGKMLWLLYLAPVVLALLWGLLTGYYWEQFDELRDGQKDSGQGS